MSLTVTPTLKEWLVEHKSLSADATDDDAAKAATDAMLDEENPLSPTKLMELTADPDAEKGNAIQDEIKAMRQEIEKLQNASKDDVSELEKMFAGSPESVRVVGAHERYDSTKSRLNYPTDTMKGHRHPLGGMPATSGGRALYDSSELEKAVGGAYFKFSLASQMGGRKNVPRVLWMTDHDRDLIKYAIHEMEWAGVLNAGHAPDPGSEVDGAMSIKTPRKLRSHEQKALLDDSTSGGLEIAPIAFDDMLITTPVLYGEFFPSVNVVNITRGRRMEGASVSSVTINSGGADGTNISLQSTATFISAFDTTIFVADAAIEFGLDFLSDSPTNIMDVVQRDYGLQMLKWLDDQIIGGDGTTEPEGVLTASGTTSVTADNGATGPPTVGDYESLMFGVAKAFKTGHPTNRIMFGANETTYSRARAVAVGGSDARRVFGMTENDYMLFGHPFGINETSFGNRQSLFGVFPRYRMYRRLAPTVKVTTEGKTLVRGNLALMTIRARFGGQIEDGSAFAVNTTGQS